MNFKFVEVHWADATADCAWSESDELVTVSHCVTRGWLVKEDEKELVLAMTLDKSNSSVGGTWAIPRGMAFEVFELLIEEEVYERKAKE